jgi:hypothetical protein
MDVKDVRDVRDVMGVICANVVYNVSRIKRKNARERLSNG